MRQIYDRLEAQRPMIYGICLKVLRHPQDAEDACQEAMIEAARGADAIRDERKFAAWARSVATTTALDLRRRLQRRRAHEAQARPNAPDPEERADLQGALQALDEPERRAVSSHYLDGRPLRELAREAGVSEVAVWKRLDKAKGKLRLFLSAGLPAAIIASCLVVAVLRPPAPAPAAPQETREPWPWELPPPGWPEPARKSWTLLQKRVTVDLEDVPLTELTDLLTGLIGHPIDFAPGALDGERLTIKVSDLSADGALRLSLQPRGRGYVIRDDGTIHVAKLAALDPAADRSRSKEVQDANRLEYAKRDRGPSRPHALVRAALAKPVPGPAGGVPLEDYLQALRQRSGVTLILETGQADGKEKVSDSDGTLPLETHLRGALGRLDLEPVPTPDGAILLTRSERASASRASAAYREQDRLENALELPMEAKDADTVPKLVRRLEKILGAPVLATKDAWMSTASAAPRAGEKVADLLDRLSTDGIRWHVRDGALFLVK